MPSMEATFTNTDCCCDGLLAAAGCCADAAGCCAGFSGALEVEAPTDSVEVLAAGASL